MIVYEQLSESGTIADFAGGSGKRCEHMRVLVVEDEERLAENIAAILRDHALCAVDTALDGEEGLFQACSVPFDLLVLDLMLPQADRSGIARKFRNQGKNSPVLILTARDEKETVVGLLNTRRGRLPDKTIRPPLEFVARAKRCCGAARASTHPWFSAVRLRLTPSCAQPASMECVSRSHSYGISRARRYLALRRGALVSKEELLRTPVRLQLGALRERLSRFLYLGTAAKLEGIAGERLNSDGSRAWLLFRPGQQALGNESSEQQLESLICLFFCRNAMKKFSASRNA